MAKNTHCVCQILLFIIVACIASTVVADVGDIPYYSSPPWFEEHSHSDWKRGHRLAEIGIIIAIVIVVFILTSWAWCTQPAAPVATQPAAPVATQPAAPVANTPQRLEVESFPLSTYSVEGGIPFGAAECIICDEAYAEGESLRSFPCRHCFHDHCTQRLLDADYYTCPVCRFDLRAPL